MRPAIIAKEVRNLGCALCNLRADGAFAVKNPHRVALKPFKAGVAKLLFPAFKVIMQRLVILLAAFRAADGINLKLQAAHAEKSKNVVCNADDLRVCGGRSRSETFKPELMELAQSSCLRLFIAVAGNKIAKLLRHRLVVKSVFKV